MFLEKVIAGVYGANCYVIADEKTNEAAVIDPGGDADKIMEVLQKNELDLRYILLTHGHGDHIGGVQELKEKTNAPVYVHKGDLNLLQDKNKNYSALMGGPVIEMTADSFLEDGSVLTLGDLKLKIIHTPGHTRGGVCIHVNNNVFTGDTLFANSIGRTDLVGGDFDIIIQSIKEKLFTLDDDSIVFPGHGPASSIGIEKTTNPFIK
ncbi:Glyoxylase, beta-lactamase superfamily II [Natronincola peptidivorans]|uniref:Glyoxylase, beta-lactamase superfamily II n=1 Tax=Natronincola peptidivorans TaxID=426128 RepID=A0A1H9YW97_9FIRM|nr:MBL fold metallo-hydrolase [Natronincola peptidivorans]SES73418.1 Glyoxylase, beta-lactamase superfamily II [Natronincola peptidivorans]